MTPEQIQHVRDELSGLHGLITVDDVHALVPDAPDDHDFRAAVRSTGFWRSRRRVNGVRRVVYVRPAQDGTTPRITTRRDPDGVPRADYPAEAARGESVLTRRFAARVGLLTAAEVRALLPRDHGLRWREIRAVLRRAGFHRTQRRLDGRVTTCFVRPCPCCGAEPGPANGSPATPGDHGSRVTRDPDADLPAELRGAYGVLAARDAARLGATRHALRRAGWRRTRARLDDGSRATRRQTVYVRPRAGDEHVWPSGLPRVAGTVNRAP